MTDFMALLDAPPKTYEEGDKLNIIMTKFGESWGRKNNGPWKIYAASSVRACMGDERYKFGTPQFGDLVSAVCITKKGA